MANLIQLMIYIDASRYSNTGKKTGVENYSYFLINELVRQFGKEITLLSPRKIKLEARQRIIPFPRLWTLIRLSWEIWKNKKINNLFVPSHVLPLIHPKNCIITIHDVAFKYSPESYSFLSGLYLNWACKFAVKHAVKIVTPSKTTGNDLIKFYNADPKKISVVPPGFIPGKASSEDCGKILKKFSLESKKYFLFIGRIEYKKNIDTLIKAFGRFVKDDNTVKLVLAGFTGHGGNEIIKSIPDNLKNHIILTGYVNDSEKSVLLKNTLCFIFPSRFEGFGIPLLEAMDAKVPIIASNIPSSKEIAGNSALFFEKENSKALTKLMKQISTDSDLRTKLIEKYDKILEKYSWKKCAEEIFGLLTGKSALLKK